MGLMQFMAKTMFIKPLFSPIILVLEQPGILNWLGGLALQLLLKSGLLGFNTYLHPALRYVEILDGAGAMRVTAKTPRL
nr:hypothetical protein Iba_chr10aCG3060 [Ipomoea batatas]GMD41749.1 hypothetical protein Iba_chr10bCG2680 [Ipomoea batatas]GMD42930.1 hypothetical protein Iba_chr10cCG0420 [Ipomoea batatas]